MYTETAGCNAVLLHGHRDLDSVLTAIAGSLCSFSSQMCTAAQNIFIPETGVWDGATRVPAAEVEQRLVAAIDALTHSPTHAAGLCGAIQSPHTLSHIHELSESVDPSSVLRHSTPYAHPTYSRARTATPLLIRASPDQAELYQREHFGPMAFAIRVPDIHAAIAHSTSDAEQFGSIANYGYSEDTAVLDTMEQSFIESGASIGLNLVKQQPINYAAAYSDFHVTGLNPAGTACLTDLAFVADRFRIVQSKRERS